MEETKKIEDITFERLKANSIERCAKCARQYDFNLGSCPKCGYAQ